MQDLVTRLKRAALSAVAAACLAALLAWSPRSSGHGGLSMDEDTCKLRVGRYVMHFVGYQPDSPSGPREFCEDIPSTGRTIVVLDYVDPELRDLPTEVRVIRDTGSAPQPLDEVTVLHLPPRLYPTGSLNFELDFAQPGRFVGLVTVGGTEKFESRFPFSVGRTHSWLHLALAAGLLAVGSVALYRFGMRRRAKAAQTPR
jgi:hypothetical protein